MTITAIGTDNIAVSGQMAAQSTSSSTYSGIMDALALTAGAAGPVMYESFLAAGDTAGAAISAASANAVFSSAMTQGSASQNLSTGSLGSSYSSSYYTGTPSYTTTVTATAVSDTDLSQNVESILTDSAASQAYLISIQAQLGSQQSTFTAVSNCINVKNSMEREAIRNFKG